MEKSLRERKKEANELRQNKKFAEALPIYEMLWKETGDKFDGTGLLNCLRKEKEFGKARSLAKELSKKFKNFEWLDREICWTLYQGQMKTFDESTKIERIIEIAQVILNHNPDDLPKCLTILKVLDLAKKHGDWQTITNWVDLIDSESLSEKKIQFDSGKSEWSHKAKWYNYKIRSLLFNT